MRDYFNSSKDSKLPQTSAFTRRKFLGVTGAGLGVLGLAGLSSRAAQAPLSPDETRALIEKALPSKAIAAPRQRRKLLIFDHNVGYGGHPSAKTANLAFKLMGEKTGAFETVVSQDPAIFKPDSLKQFGAVFLNNTVGNLFTEPELRKSLVEFVCGGGGLMGVHGTTVAFTQWPGAIEDWPEFGFMLGARGANHRDSDEHVFIKLEDPEHPLNQAVGGKDFDYRDEFFRAQGTYSRKRVRVLFSIDNLKSTPGGPPRGNAVRADNDYALAWVRQYGRGRVFYCTIAHNPYVFWDPKMLNFYLAAAQFALGDLDAPTIPSARVTPALAKQERLGWRLGLPSDIHPQLSLYEVLQRASELGLLYIGGSDMQPLMRSLAGETPSTADKYSEFRLAMDASGVRMLTYHLTKSPTSPEGWRDVFQLGRKLGVETLIGRVPDDLNLVEKLANESNVNYAFYYPYEKTGWTIMELLKLCSARSTRIGICGNMAHWAHSEFDFLEAIRPGNEIRLLRERLLVLYVHDLHQPGARGHDLVWGTGSSKLKEVFYAMLAGDFQPTMFGLDYRTFGPNLNSELADSIKFFNQTTLELPQTTK